MLGIPTQYDCAFEKPFCSSTLRNLTHSCRPAWVKALGVFNKYGDTSRAYEIMNKMNVGPDEIRAARKAWRITQNEFI